MPPLPVIPGIELAGTIVEHGPGTTQPPIGQPVFVSARDLPVRAGCYAEYIAVPAHAQPCSVRAWGGYNASESDALRPDGVIAW